MAGRELTITPTKRERRKSPAVVVGFTADPPISPTSSVADTTFEPTIDMMVNDFDDEATLNEEEALADLEAHSAEDEIATLREESEMPIEELLAKYSSMTGGDHLGAGMGSSSSLKRSSSGSVSSSRRRRANKRHCQETEPEEAVARPSSTCVASSASADLSEPEQKTEPEQEDYSTPLSSAQCSEAGMDADEVPETNKPKSHRSHLLDLYPEQSFANNNEPQVEDVLQDEESFTPLQTLFEQVEAEAEEDDSDTDSDDVRKIIMVGADYQAEIPEGLSQYGDILPYENEDQLIWEPSQVTEREVEDYLAKIQEARSWSTAAGEEGAAQPEGDGEAQEEKLPSSPGEDTTPSVAPVTAPVAPLATAAPAAAPVNAANQDLDAVVKDNEQALHLLVQCGYDFKEALRRKRLNVLPLSDTMSSWSEEECDKFEEGIQKFGKDFYQIRQNQVRTRTMRELVQFYYLWKKSERRDQCFALNDTIDHMDVFINEGEERAANGMGMGTGNGNGNGNGSGTGNEHGNGNGNGSCSSHSSGSNSNGHSNGVEHNEKEKEKENRKATTKNYSIMTGSQLGTGTVGGTSNGNNGTATPSSGTSRKHGASLEALEEHDEAVQEAAKEVDNLS